MLSINPYLTFNGNCEAAMMFYKSIFGGEFSDFNRFSDFSNEGNEGGELPADKLEGIMHIAYPIGENTVLMASDAHPLSPPVVFGQHISLSISADSKEKATEFFTKLAEGGVVTMPIADTFWGAYFGMLDDKFGISWLINYDYPT